MQDWERKFLDQQRVARLATLGPDGQVHVVPVVYACEENWLYTPIDEKPKRVAAERLQRVRDIQANPQVALVIDRYSENWDELAWVQVRGPARLITEGELYGLGIKRLAEKYLQYREMPLEGNPLILVELGEVVSWQASASLHS